MVTEMKKVKGSDWSHQSRLPMGSAMNKQRVLIGQINLACLWARGQKKQSSDWSFQSRFIAIHKAI
jgi:hypothetical protein